MRQLVLGLILISLACGSCAPGLRKNLSVNYIEPLTSELEVDSVVSGLRLKLGEFSDTRPHPDIGEIDGRSLLPEGDPAQASKLALQEYLRLAGANLVVFDAPIIRGEVKSWYVSVKPAFPASEVNAKAEIRIALEDAGGKPLYAAVYSGSINKTHPMLGQDEVEKALGDAMSYALVEAIRDRKLAAALSAAH